MKKNKSHLIKVFLILFVFFVFTFLTLLHYETFAKANQVYIIKIKDDTINPITADYIIKSIDKAYQDNSECLIVELDTPGGLLTSTRTIIKEILSSKIPVCIYIYPSGSRAGSAGVFITYASHIAAMAPSTNIGAAHPVSLGGGRRSTWDALRDLIDSFSKKDKEEKGDKTKKLEKDIENTDVMADKILNDTIAFIKSIAKERNRNVEWAERSIRESASITEEEALKNNVIEIIAKDEGDLLKQLDGRRVKIDNKTIVLKTKDASIVYIDMNSRQRFLNVLANPNIAYILLLLGFYGLLYEITHPGVGFPGIAGTICIILAFFSLQILPTNYTGLALIFLAIILFIAEAKVPGFGLLTLGGIVCMILGSLILFESPYKIMRVSLMLVISSSLATAGITIFLVGAVVKAHKRRIISGKEGLIGEIGQAKTDIGVDKEGKVFVHGETWNAIAHEEIKTGEKIKVVKVDRMSLIVERCD
ncbi:nodulation protein NfeD [bacterium]|nr:MAG: nodulation protein NfeD [bacterium]